MALGRVGTGRARRRRRTPAGLVRPRAAPPASELDVAKVLEYVGLIIAPTTLVTALVYWLGFELVDARSEYFGLGTGTLGFSTTDYLLRGAEAGIVPLFVLFTAILVAAVLHAAVTAVAARAGQAPWVRRAAWIMLAAGTAVFVTGLVGLFMPLPAPLDWYLLRPALLAAGPLVAIEAVRLLRAGTGGRPSRAAAVAVVGLVALGVFWAMSIYADALGRGRAIDLADQLRALPAVRVYSERPLGVDPTIAAGGQLPNVDERYRYRYTRLRLLVRSSGKYFLVPDGWTRATGTVLVLPDTADIRVEFSPGGS
jgi:hypothetical protein